MTLHVDLTPEIYEKALKIAREQQMQVEDVVMAACAEHIAVWERLEQRAARGDREKFLAVLAKVADVVPPTLDR